MNISQVPNPISQLQYQAFYTKEKFIYKYHPYNQYLIENLLKNQLYFSPPAEFSDVYDCRFKLTLEPDEESASKYYSGLNLSDKELEIKMAEYQADPTIFIKDKEKEFNFNFRTEYGVTCFSEKNDVFLLWANYADKHQGVCLVFDWLVHKEYFMGYKVQYNDTLPEVYYDGKGIFEVGKTVTNKLKYMDFEHEVRACAKLDDGPNRLVTFNPKALKGVVFGERLSKSNQKTITNIIKNHDGYKDVDFYSQTSDDDLKIKIEKIN